MDDAFQRICSIFRAGGPRDPYGSFDATWQELSASNPDLSTEDKIALMKKKLAHRILVSATAGGIRDVETLKEHACGASVAVFA